MGLSQNGKTAVRVPWNSLDLKNQDKIIRYNKHEESELCTGESSSAMHSTNSSINRFGEVPESAHLDSTIVSMGTYER